MTDIGMVRREHHCEKCGGHTPAADERDPGHNRPPAMTPRPGTYIVEIARLHDRDERDVIRVVAYGEQDIRQQVREFHPGWYVRGWDEVQR